MWILICLFWFWAGKAKISRKTATERIEKKAKENGEKPNLSGVEFDGFDVRETFRDQFKYNNIAAFLAAAAISFQTLNQIF